jgi:hypothetical protein
MMLVTTGTLHRRLYAEESMAMRGWARPDESTRASDLGLSLDTLRALAADLAARAVTEAADNYALTARFRPSPWSPPPPPSLWERRRAAERHGYYRAGFCWKQTIAMRSW